MSITRRLFLRQTAAAAGVGTAVGSTAAAELIQPMTPDERIEAALDEIKAALLERWPNAPLRITDCENTRDRMILILTHCAKDKPGAVRHERIGTARRAAGGPA